MKHKWQQREKYLLSAAQRYLTGHKIFDLCRAHLIEFSQISRGTIYNHFPLESDLIVALGCEEYQEWHRQALALQQKIADPFLCFVLHHCLRLQQILSEQRFVIYRVLPNQPTLDAASDSFRQQFIQAEAGYQLWNQQLIAEIGICTGYDRHQLITDFIRGAFIHADDAEKRADDILVYRQFIYALQQLLGQSDRNIADLEIIEQHLLKIE